MSINDDFTTSVSSENDSVAHEDYSDVENNEQKNNSRFDERGKQAINSTFNDVNENNTDSENRFSDGFNGDIVVDPAETKSVSETEVSKYFGCDIKETTIKYYGDKEWAALREDAVRIVNLDHDMVSGLRERGELSEEDDKKYTSLLKIGVDAKNLTVDEMSDVLDYAFDKTEEIRTRKTERLYDALNRHINGVRSRHDGMEPAFYNPVEAERKDAIRDKYLAWERGEFNLERGFDVEEAYNRLIEEGYEPSEMLRRHLEEEDFEDLYDEGLVDDDLRFVYGPFTEENIKDMDVFESRTWTDITNSRYFDNSGRKSDSLSNAVSGVAINNKKVTGKSLSNLLDETIRANSASPEVDLVYDYIASEVLQTHRLKAKELLIASSAVALDTLNIEGAESGRQEEILKSMRGSVSYISYYLGKIFGRSSSEMKERFGSTRPISKEFLTEMVGEIKELSPSRVEYVERYFKPLLTKLDEHFRNLLNNKVIVYEKSSIMDEYSEELD